MKVLLRCRMWFCALWLLAWHQWRAQVYIHRRGAVLWGGLDASQQRRCRHYFRGAVFLGAVFAAYRGWALEAQEMRRYAHLAALAALFDDCAERCAEIRGTLAPLEAPAEHAQLSCIPRPLLSFAQKADPSGDLVFFLKKIQDGLVEGTAASFEEALLRVFEMETGAAWRLNAPASVGGLVEAAAQKGAWSALLFRLLLEPVPSAAERRAALLLGAMVQASDDLFDLWHDARQGWWTPARWWASDRQWVALAQHFEQRWQLLACALEDGPPETANRRLAAKALAELLAVLTRFCLQHYQELAEKHGTLPWHDRHAMVLDMARWSTRWRAVVFAFKNGFLSE